METKSWIEFIEEVIPLPVDRKVFRLFIKASLNGERHERLLYLYGIGCNGKSTLKKVIAGLFNPSDVSHEQIEDLIGKDDYRHIGNIDSKKINISTGFDFRKLKETQLANFKKLINGERLMYRELYQRPKFTSSTPNFICDGNIIDRSFVNHRRVIFIEMPKVIEEVSQISLLADVLLQEKQQIIEWFIE